MSNKFRYLLFPDQIYLVEFTDYDGKIFQVEIPGNEIVAKLRREYALDNFLEKLDKETEIE